MTCLHSVQGLHVTLWNSAWYFHTYSRVNAITLCLVFSLSRSACTVTERKSLRPNQLWPLKHSSLPNSPLRSPSPRPRLLLLPAPLPPPPPPAPSLPRQHQEEGWRAPLLPGGSRKHDGHKWGRHIFTGAHVDHTSFYWYPLSGQIFKKKNIK